MRLKSWGRRWTIAVGLCVVASGVAATTVAVGCGETLLKNLTTNVTGNIHIVFVNDTDYRAALTYGTYDSLDRDPPGPANLKQLRIEARASDAAVDVPCLRNCAVGTKEFIKRVVDLKLDKSTTGFDVDAFDSVVHFSDAPSTSPLAAAPVIGTAEGVEKLLGVQYNCDDELIFTLREDPDATGGFRIDFELIQH